MGMRMTAQAGAPIDDAAKWTTVDWSIARQEVRRLQMRIAKAVKENRWNKVKSLQHLLSRSFYAKLLAVQRVTSNKERRPLASTASFGKAPEPNGGLRAACTGVATDRNRFDGSTSRRRTVRCAR